MGRVFRTTTRVRFAETDAAGIVYYNNYFIYFELGRVSMFRELGLAYDWRVPIAEAYCDFKDSARFDDLLEIRTHLTEIRRCGFRMAHEVHRVDTVAATSLVAEGYAAMVYVGDDRRPIELPEEFKVAFSSED